MFSGGAVERMAIFSQNIMPYISASIIFQLLQTVSPSLEALKKEGDVGPQDPQSVHALSHRGARAFQAYGIAIGLEGSGNIVVDPGWFFRISTSSRSPAARCS